MALIGCRSQLSSLSLAEAKAKSYVSRMLIKLGCANRTQAGLLAYDAGAGHPLMGWRYATEP